MFSSKTGIGCATLRFIPPYGDLVPPPRLPLLTSLPLPPFPMAPPSLTPPIVVVVGVVGLLSTRGEVGVRRAKKAPDGDDDDGDDAKAPTPTPND